MKKTILILVALTITLATLAGSAGAIGSTRFEFGPGSLTTTNPTAGWGGLNIIEYPVVFDGTAGPITLEIQGLDLSAIDYRGDMSWPPDSTDIGALAAAGLRGSGRVWYQVLSNMAGGGCLPGGTCPDWPGCCFWREGKRAWNSSGPFTNSDGYRSYLFQGWDGVGVAGGNHQLNAEQWGDGLHPEYDTVDIRFEYLGGTVSAWVRLHHSWSWDAGNATSGWGCPWQIAKNTAWNPDAIYDKSAGCVKVLPETTGRVNGAWVPVWDGPWTTTSDMSAVKPYVFIQNWANAAGPYTVTWDNLVVTGVPVLEEGMATGGGWFIPEDTGQPGNVTPGGKATFGFVARQETSTSSGQLEFQYKTDDLNLKSTSYDWVTVSSTQVIFEGAGTLNGEPDYKFRVWAFDGDKAGGQPDRFTIRIWTGGGSFESPTYRAEGDLGGGQIVVHKK